MGVAVFGYVIAAAFYATGGWKRAEALRGRFAPLYNVLWNKYYFDDLYLWLVRRVQQGIAVICRFFEETVVVGMLVGYPTRFTRWTGDRLRQLQVGRLNFYVYCFAGGVTVLVLILLLSEGMQ